MCWYPYIFIDVLPCTLMFLCEIRAIKISYSYSYLTNIHVFRSWPRPTCLCHLCSALLVWMIDWLIIFISINVTPKYVHWGRGCPGVTTMLSLAVPLVVFVTACGATGRCEVVTLTAHFCSSVYTLRILIVLISINSPPIHVRCGWGCRCDDYVVACVAVGSTCDSLRCHR